MSEENNKKLFDWIYDLIISEGGDGDAVIGFKHQDYREVAKQFREYFPSFWEMDVKPTNITFVDNQQYITLTSKEDFEATRNWGPRILTW